MRIANKLSIGAALIGSVILSFAGAAQAYDHGDRDRWDHDRDRGDHRSWDHGRHHEHDRIVERRFVDRPVYVREHRPMIVERPVFVAPQQIYQEPVYQAPGPSGLNLNFNIPLN